MMEQFAAYGHAIVAMAGTAIFGLPQPALGDAQIGDWSGTRLRSPTADYSSAVYRWHRAYGNLTETMGFFVAWSLAAILAGASPFWVNLSCLDLLSSAGLVLAFVHIGASASRT